MKKLYKMTAVALLTGMSFSVIPAVTNTEPAAEAVTVISAKRISLGSVTINKIPNATVNQGTKATISPNYSTSGNVKVSSARITVRKNGKRIAYKQNSYSLGKGTYKVTTTVKYRQQYKNGKRVYWSSLKTKQLTQTFTVTENAAVKQTTPKPTVTPTKTTTTTSALPNVAGVSWKSSINSAAGKDSIVSLINYQRAQKGLPALTRSSSLDAFVSSGTLGSEWNGDSVNFIGTNASTYWTSSPTVEQWWSWSKDRVNSTSAGSYIGLSVTPTSHNTVEIVVANKK